MNKMESAFWRQIREGLSPFMRLRRIENMVGDGDPDVYCYRRGWSCWLELKAKELPARPTTKVYHIRGLRPAQISYIEALIEEGISASILARASDHIFLVPGRWAEQFNDFNYADLMARADWHHKGRMGGKDWEMLAEAIREGN